MKVVYGFSDRRFGDMRKDESLTRFLDSLTVGGVDVVWPKQTHGNGIAQVSKADAGRIIPEVDGLVTAERGLFLAVLVADCLPVLCYDSRRKLVGAVHAGWRGTVARIAVKMVEEFMILGANPRDLRAILGPSICVQHYEVGEDVVAQFAGQDEAVFIREDGRTYLNIRSTNRNQLLGAGIPEDSIEINPTCTFEDGDLYSWRREKPSLSGMFTGVIGIV